MVVAAPQDQECEGLGYSGLGQQVFRQQSESSRHNRAIEDTLLKWVQRWMRQEIKKPRGASHCICHKTTFMDIRRNRHCG